MRIIWTVIALLLVASMPLLAQEPAASAPTGSLTAPPGEWQSSIVLGFLLTSFWEWLKKNPIVTFVDGKSAKRAQRAAGLLLAFATSIGLNYTFEPSAGRLVIEGLTWTSILGSLKDFGWQFVVNETIYRKVVKPGVPTTAPVAAPVVVAGVTP